MDLALKEAQKGEGFVSPNPLVGAVLMYDGKVIVKGFHGEMGKLHAERVVLEKLQIMNDELPIEKCTLYVTLEPCCHHGKTTPPCSDALIASGIKKVIIAQTDPNPFVNGKGTEQLRSAGIEVIEGILEKEAKEQIRFFRHWITKKEPYFVGKLAVSVDGMYAITNDQLRITNKKNYFLISSEKTKEKTRAMRQAFDAILIGKKTLLADNPHLGSDTKDPIRIVLCQKADFSVKNLQAFRDDNVIIACKEKIPKCDFTGHFIFYTDLKNLKQQIFDLKIQSLLVEGGGDVFSLFLKGDLLQELLIIQSKKCILEIGKKMPKIPQSFSLVSQQDCYDDVLLSYKKN